MLRLRINWLGPASGFSIVHTGETLATSGAAQAAADAVSDWLTGLGPHLADAQGGQVDNEVLQINVGTGQTEGVETVSTSAVGGSGGNNQVPQASMLLVRWRTGNFIGGREVRGRTFVPGVGTGGSEPDGEVLPALITAVDTVNAALITDPVQFGVWSPTRSNFSSATSASVWPEFAVMRSRRE